MTTGTILHLQRLSTEDGPGIRTTVFFKGCPLHCEWCHNPESIAAHLQTQWFAAHCLGCRTCVDTCPHGCLTMEADGLHIDRARCQHCGKCAQACPAGALEALGKTVSVEELLAELVKDRAYYEHSGGGVTLSGGEPTLQADFAEELLVRLHAEGIATALDTCGLCSRQTLERLLKHTDLVLYDLKVAEAERHRALTGVSNERILENLAFVREYARTSAGALEIWVRTPLIPGATAEAENLRQIGALLAEKMDGSVSRWELCAFNNLCREQYTRLGLEWAYAHTPLLTRQELENYEQAARSSGFNPEKILATGATQAAVKPQ